MRKALRTFRLDRVSGVEVCAAGFERPSDFDARAYLRERMPFIQSAWQIDVWIDMPIEDAERMFVPMRVVVEAEDGGTRLRCGRDRLEMFAGMLLGMGRRVVVRGPGELREVFRGIAERAVEAAGG